MTWIRTIPPDQADPELRARYERLYQLHPPEYAHKAPALLRDDGTADSIVAAHSLIPPVMEHIFSALALLFSPDLPLTRRQHEMIATLVSKLNECFY